MGEAIDLVENFKVEKVTLKTSDYTYTMLPSLNQQSPCFYVVETKAKRAITNSQNTDYEMGDTVVPILSCSASGIHSMRANVLCKATNIKGSGAFAQSRTFGIRNGRAPRTFRHRAPRPVYLCGVGIRRTSVLASVLSGSRTAL